MKHTKKCPKCTSSRIAGPHRQFFGLNLTTFRSVKRFCYVCADCGYAESYVDSKDFEKINKYGLFETHT